MNGLILRTAAVLAALLLASGAQAIPITYEISGQITDVLPVGHGITSVMVGDTWSATIVIDSDTPDTQSGNPNEGQYEGFVATYQVGNSITLNVTDAPGNNHRFVEIFDDVFSYGAIRDEVRFEAAVPLGPPQQIDGIALTNIFVGLGGPTLATFSDDLLSSSFPLTISDFDTSSPATYFRIDLNNDGGPPDAVIIGSVSSYQVVPIPATVWLFGSALAGLGWLRGNKPSSRRKVRRW